MGYSVKDISILNYVNIDKKILYNMLDSYIYYINRFETKQNISQNRLHIHVELSNININILDKYTSYNM